MTVTVVTRSNFASMLAPILHHIREADFIAFDTELTGLTTGSQSRYFYYDDVGDRYRKLRDSASSFGMLQLGLSAWKHKPSGDKYTSTSWSFHLFPVVGGSAHDYRKWTLQLSSIAFLREHGFDFNKTFLEGIPYLSLREEGDLRGRKGQARADKDVSINADDAAWLTETVEQVRRWFDSEAGSSGGGDAEGGGGDDGMGGGDGEADNVKSNNNNKTDSSTSSPLLVLAPCNSFKRLLLHQTLPKEFGEAILLKKMDNVNGETCLSVTRVDAETRRAQLAEEQAEFERSVAEQIGFRRIFDLVTSLRKPMVGHNCWLDLCHIFHKLVGPMPGDWETFCEELGALNWGPLCDTKFIASRLIRDGLLGAALPGTSLQELATAVDDAGVWGAKVRVDGGKTRNRAKESFHDAGFDAYCTGKVLVGAATHLAKKMGAPSVQAAIDAMFAGGSEYAGRLFMMQSDVEGGVSLDRAHAQWQPDRSHLSVLADLTPAIGVSHLHSLLTALGADKTKLQLSWYDSKTVLFACEGFEAPRGELACPVGAEMVRLQCLPYAAWKQTVVVDSPPSAKRIRPVG